MKAAFISKPIQSTVALPLAALMFTAFATLAADNSGRFNALDYGAKGDGTNDDTAAIQQAVEACAAKGGGQVVLPGGKIFLAGAITLRSGVDFHLARGAVLKGSPRWRDYGEAGALLFARDANDVSISGDGALDGNDHAVWQELADETAGGDANKPGWWPQAFCGVWWPFGRSASDKTLAAGRPMAVILIGCKHVRVRDITIRNAPSWTMHPVGCEDVVIDSISILNDWNVANNDGIVLKNTPNFAGYGRSENITVTGCTIASRSCALKLDEAYAPPGIRNVVFDACVIFRSNRGLCIQSRDEGDIENVLFSNITIETQLQPSKWWGAGEPIHISLLPRNPKTKLGHVRQIRFSNILCKGESGIYLRGCAAQPLEDIVFDNVRVELGKSSGVAGGFYDDRPIGTASAGGQFAGIYSNTIAGVFAREVNGLTLRHTQVVWDAPKDSMYGEALDQDKIQDLTLEHDSFSATTSAK
jgi:polygalacturonase